MRPLLSADQSAIEGERILGSFYEHAPLMLGVVETDGDEITYLSVNPAAAKFLGSTLEKVRNRKAHELGASRSQINRWIEHYRKCETSGKPVRFSYEHLTSSGSAWFSATVTFVGKSKEGRSQFTFIIEDITAHRAADEELKRRQMELLTRNKALLSVTTDLAESNELLTAASQRFQELFQGLPMACFTYDQDGRIFESNRECEKLYGWHGSQLLGRVPWETIWSGTEPERTRSLVERVFAGETFEAIDETIIRPDGQIRHILCSTFPLHGADGLISGAMCASLDITDRKKAEEALGKQIRLVQDANKLLEEKGAELEQLNRRLAALADTDGLTGLNNHQAFQHFLEQEFQRSLRFGSPLSLVLLDVDHFKQYNDTFGHPAGDRVLRAVAEVLRQEARVVDFVARYGGEEFALILPETAADGARAAAERLRVAIVEIEGFERPITASVGVSSLSLLANSKTDLIEQADEAMYFAKNHGRNAAAHYLDILGPELAAPTVDSPNRSKSSS